MDSSPISSISDAAYHSDSTRPNSPLLPPLQRRESPQANVDPTRSSGGPDANEGLALVAVEPAESEAGSLASIWWIHLNEKVMVIDVERVAKLSILPFDLDHR